MCNLDRDGRGRGSGPPDGALDGGGGEGATGWTAAGRVDVPPVAVQVIDTVGAGDTFQAALLTALAECGWLSREAMAALGAAPLQRVLHFAAQAAAITCSRRGADLPRRAELPAV